MLLKKNKIFKLKFMKKDNINHPQHYKQHPTAEANKTKIENFPEGQDGVEGTDF